MNKLLTLLAALGATSTVMCTLMSAPVATPFSQVAFAATEKASAAKATTPKASAAKKAPVAKCPKCKMTLSTKKDKMHNTAMKLNGKTYYCCSACKDHTAPAAKTKNTALPQCPVCKMHAVSTKKDAAHPYAVKLNGKTYYSCCKEI